MTKRYKTVSTEVIHSHHGRAYKHSVFENDAGVKGDFYFIERLGAAIAVPVLPDGRLVFVAQQRHLQDRLSMEFPCGNQEPGETPSETVKRELLEEAGYICDDLVKVGTFEPVSRFVKSPMHVFVADQISQTATPLAMDFEQTEVMYRRVDEFEEMIKRGEIWDGKTLAAWAMARDHVLKILASIAS